MTVFAGFVCGGRGFACEHYWGFVSGLHVLRDWFIRLLIHLLGEYC